jgi:arylsulfatase A-like enzyme
MVERLSLASCYLCVLAVAALSCKPAHDLEPSHDLVALAPFAELALESGIIDFGTTGAREHLIEGWSRNERSGDGATFSWSLGERSLLSFDALSPRDIPVRLRCQPRPTSGDEPVSMEVFLNDHPLATLELSGGWSEHDLTLPANLVETGRNLLGFRYQIGPPVAATPGDKRDISVAWDWMRLAGSTGTVPQVEDDGVALSLTAGTRVDYFLQLQAGSRLALERLRFDPATRSRLLIDLTRDGGEETRIADIAEQSESVHFAIDGSGLYRLRLTALAGRDSQEPARLRLTRPAILSPSLPTAEAAPTEAENPPSREPPPRPNILVYLVDTLRADRLGAYGSEAGLTPLIDSFAEESIVFERALAQSAWTLPSVTSLFTGVWPLTHGAQQNDSQIPEELPTLPEMLRPAGYRTAALLTSGWVSAERGFDRGVDYFQRIKPSGCEDDLREILSGASRWLDDPSNAREPFFLYVHSREPHAPYAPPEHLRSRFAPAVADLEIGSADYLNDVKLGTIAADHERLAAQLALYNGEVACADWAFGELLDLLREKGLYDDTLIVLLADHGEEFREHGSLTHGHSLHREVVDIPLILRLPRGEHGGTRVAWGGQHIDVLPTLLGYLDLDRPPYLRGRNLLVSLSPDSTAAGARGPRFSALRTQVASVVFDGWKAIARQQRLRTDVTELYDLGADPWEQTDLARERPVLTGYLLSLIRREMLASQQAFAAEPIEIDAETEAELRALGYLN